MKTFFIEIINYFKTLISSSDEASSKRFISFYCLLLLTACVICSLNGVKIDVNILWALVSLIGGAQILTVIKAMTGGDKV